MYTTQSAVVSSASNCRQVPAVIHRAS